MTHLRTKSSIKLYVKELMCMGILSYLYVIIIIMQGLNFQLAAVILSVGVYAYIENSQLYYQLTTVHFIG